MTFGERVRRLQSMRKNLTQLINDKESWNDNRPEMPLDVGWEKTMRHYVEKQLEALDNDNADEAMHWQANMDEHVKTIQEV